MIDNSNPILNDTNNYSPIHNRSNPMNIPKPFRNNHNNNIADNATIKHCTLESLTPTATPVLANKEDPFLQVASSSQMDLDNNRSSAADSMDLDNGTTGNRQLPPSTEPAWTKVASPAITGTNQQWTPMTPPPSTLGMQPNCTASTPAPANYVDTSAGNSTANNEPLLAPSLQQLPLGPCPVDDQGHPRPRTFSELVHLIRHEMGDRGLADCQVNVPRLQAMMGHYQSQSEEWREFAFFDKFRYTRNLVDDGNGKYNLLLLCWGEDHASPIHDHANAHCILKVMDGQLTETLYEWPEGAAPLPTLPSTVGQSAVNSKETLNNPTVTDEDHSPSHTSLHVTSVRHLQKNAAAYMHDRIGLHRVANTCHERPAVSLHLYSPPIDVCQTFCERTGRARKSGKCVFFSVNGQRTSTCSAGLGDKTS
jgi:cysteine dioxygenase